MANLPQSIFSANEVVLITCPIEKIQTDAKQLYCSACPNLKNISGTKLTSLDLFDCLKISSLNIPRVQKFSYGVLYSRRPHSFDDKDKKPNELYLPGAESIDISHMHLKKLKTPQLKQLECSFCEIDDWEAPKLEKVTIYDSKFPKNISFPSVQFVKIDDLNSSSLNLPEAKTVSLEECEHLQELSIPNAERLTVRYCPLIKEISNPNTISFSGFSCSFNKLELKNATKIKLSFCKLPESLSFDSVKKIELFHCKKIQKLSAKKAEKVEVIDTDINESVIDAPFLSIRKKSIYS